MRYLVTGGAGFIGSNTVDELVRRGGHDDRNARAQQFDRDLSGNPAAAGGVFAVNDYEIDIVLFLQFRQSPDDSVAARFANDIAEEKNR